MGIDWYSCNKCGETFPDCGDYVGCECGEHWCSEECASEHGYRREEACEENDWVESSCKYCRKEDVEDYALLSTALKLLGLTRDDLIKNHFENK